MGTCDRAERNHSLVEAASDQLSDLLAAVDVAVVSNMRKYDGFQVGGFLNSLSEIPDDSHFVGKNVTFFASAGDSGHGVSYRAASPYVMGVGGTTLQSDKDGTYQSEKAWADSGGGISSLEIEPVYQATFPGSRVSAYDAW